MARKRSLVIKDWLGTGKGSLKLEIVDFEIQSYSHGKQYFERVTIRRKPDQHSSRFGMMANLNKRHGKLSWGFPGFTIKIKEFSNSGAVIAREEYSFSGTGVENTSTNDGLEVLIFVTNRTGSQCIGNCDSFLNGKT